MANAIDTTIHNILTAANASAEQAYGLNTAGQESNIPAGAVFSTQTPYPKATSFSELTGLDEPVPSDIGAAITTMIEDIRNLYEQHFPTYEADMVARAGAAQQFTDIINDNIYAVPAMNTEMDMIVAEQNEKNRLLFRDINVSWARRGFAIVPGPMIQQVTETYHEQWRALFNKKMEIADEAIGMAARQHKIALQEMAVTLDKSRSSAIDAAAALITAAAKQSAFPSTEYASLVDVKASLADALMARYAANKAFNDRLLEVYDGNIDVAATIDRYNAQMHTREVQNTISLAVNKAEAIGRSAAALWNQINVIASASTVSFE